MVSDVRRRRAERARHGRWRHLLPQYGKYALIGVVLVAAIGAAATIYQPPAAKKFIHDHATFAVFIGGEQERFVHRDYDMGVRGMNTPHMHVGDGMEVWHIEGSFEGGVSDVTVEDSLQVANGVIFRQGYMKLDTMGGHNGSEWRDQGNATWKVYVSKMVGDERGPFELAPEGPQYIPRNLDEVLITYGDLSEEELARQQAAVPRPPGG